MKQLEKYQQIERSIITKYRKSIWKKFTAAISEFEMIEKNDKIAVCISGGKDSMLMAKCMQEIKKHGHTDFELEFIKRALAEAIACDHPLKHAAIADACQRIGIAPMVEVANHEHFISVGRPNAEDKAALNRMNAEVIVALVVRALVKEICGKVTLVSHIVHPPFVIDKLDVYINYTLFVNKLQSFLFSFLRLFFNKTTFLFF